jgi:hypothetical protein
MGSWNFEFVLQSNLDNTINSLLDKISLTEKKIVLPKKKVDAACFDCGRELSWSEVGGFKAHIAHDCSDCVSSKPREMEIEYVAFGGVKKTRKTIEHVCSGIKAYDKNSGGWLCFVCTGHLNKSYFGARR